MKYYYLFILIVIISGGISEGRILSTSELNNNQVSQVENSITRSQYEEKGVANKADGLMVNTPYYIRRLCNDTKPMVASNQFVMPVLKFGIPGKEPEFSVDSNESHLTYSE